MSSQSFSWTSVMKLTSLLMSRHHGKLLLKFCFFQDSSWLSTLLKSLEAKRTSITRSMTFSWTSKIFQTSTSKKLWEGWCSHSVLQELRVKLFSVWWRASLSSTMSMINQRSSSTETSATRWLILLLSFRRQCTTQISSKSWGQSISSSKPRPAVQMGTICSLKITSIPCMKISKTRSFSHQSPETGMIPTLVRVTSPFATRSFARFLRQPRWTRHNLWTLLISHRSSFTITITILTPSAHRIEKIS